MLSTLVPGLSAAAQSKGGDTPPPQDAYAFLSTSACTSAQAVAPLNVIVGQVVVLNLCINSGSGLAWSQQTYFSYPATMVMNVDSSGNPSSQVQPVLTTFGTVTQNQTFNNSFRASVAYASHGSTAFRTGTFAVAVVRLKALRTGTVTLHFLFDAPNQVSRITDNVGNDRGNPALYPDYMFTIDPAAAAAMLPKNLYFSA